MGRWRAIERVTWQDGEGHTNVVEKGHTTDNAEVVAHVPYGFEDTSKDPDLGPGTNVAEQMGLEAEGSAVRRDEVHQEADFVRTGPFASSNLPTSKGAEATTSGAEVGSKEDLADAEAFREVHAKADEEAEKRREDDLDRQLQATDDQINNRHVRDFSKPAPSVAGSKPVSKVGDNK